MMKRKAAALAFALLLSAGRASARPETRWREGPEVFVLSTGLRCIYHHDRSSPTTVAALFAAGGTSGVPPGQDGLAYLTTRLTLEIPDDGKVRELMSQATRLSLVCEPDCSAVVIECLSENFEQALRVESAIVQDPLITAVRIGRVKELMELYGRALADDPPAAGREAVLRAFFDGRGYGSAVHGTENSRKSIGRKDALAYYRRFFTKPNLFFCVATDLDKERVRALLETYFNRFPGGEPWSPAPASPALPPIPEVVLAKDTKQTFVGRAFALPAPDIPGQAKGALLETLLGEGPESRLWGLRATEKLAYNVDARVTWTRGSGILEAFLETGNAKSGRAAEALDRALAVLLETGLTEPELLATKAMAKAQFLRRAEAKASRVRTLGLFEVLGLGPGHLEGFFEAVDKVTLDEMNDYIRAAISPGRALKITIGPAVTGRAEGGR